jgi:4-oxalocrotonate tautomerase
MAIAIVIDLWRSPYSAELTFRAQPTPQEDSMPVVSVQVPEGFYTPQMKKDLVARFTDAIVEVEGIPALKPAVTVLISEVADGGWGSGGHAATLADMKRRYGIA